MRTFESLSDLHHVSFYLLTSCPLPSIYSPQRWRAFRSDARTEAAVNFIDGDLIEAFLDLRPAVQADVAAAVRAPLDEVLRRVEELARMH